MLGSGVAKLLPPGELRATKGNEPQCGLADADEIVRLKFCWAEDRPPAQTHEVGLAAMLQIEAALLFVIGDEGVLLARDHVITEVQADALTGVAPERVHTDKDRAKAAASRSL